MHHFIRSILARLKLNYLPILILSVARIKVCQKTIAMRSNEKQQKFATQNILGYVKGQKQEQQMHFYQRAKINQSPISRLLFVFSKQMEKVIRKNKF